MDVLGLFNGQRHERDGRPVPFPQSGATEPILLRPSSRPGLYPRAAARRQRPGRTLQRPLAGQGLAAVGIASAPVLEGQLGTVSDVLSRMKTNSCVINVLTLVG
jgi:hypothetical protein